MDCHVRLAAHPGVPVGLRRPLSLCARLHTQPLTLLERVPGAGVRMDSFDHNPRTPRSLPLGYGARLPARRRWSIAPRLATFTGLLALAALVGWLIGSR